MRRQAARHRRQGRHRPGQPRGRRPRRPQGRRPRGPREGRQGDRPRRHPAVDARSTRSTARGCLDDLTTLVTEIGDKLDVIMVPKVEGPWDIHYIDRLLAQLEAKAGIDEAAARPRDPRDRPGRRPRRGDRRRLPAHAGHELRPGRPRRLAPHEDHPRRRRPPRLPVDLRPGSRTRTARSATRRGSPRSRTRGTTRSPAWSTPARPTASCRSTARSATSRTSSPARPSSARRSCWAASAPGRCTPCRSTSPRRSSPRPVDEVLFAKKVIEAIPDGRGVHMIDGKMQDDATWKQCKVMVDLADDARREGPGAEPRPRRRPTALAA